MNFKYLIIKIIYIISGRDMNILINFFRKCGIDIGDKCYIYSNIITSECELIKIGNNVTISNDVQFVTHDNSVSKVNPMYTDIFGEIHIGNNCFIGAKVLILPGVHIAENIIIGSGSVVTKSFIEKGIIIAGNPAKKIGTIEEYTEKINKYLFNIDGLTIKQKKKLLEENKQKLIKK